MLTFHPKRRFGARTSFQLPERLKLEPRRRPGCILDYRVDPHGVFASAKMACMVPWGERSERDFMLLLEADSRVARYERRPTGVSAQILFGGQRRDYVPNFRVDSWDAAPLLIALCTQDHLLHPLHMSIVTALKQAYLDQGLQLNIVETPTIYQEPRFSNSRAIVEARNTPIQDEWSAWMAELIPAGGSRTLGEVEAVFGGGAPAREKVLALISNGVLVVDVGAPLDSQARVALGRIKTIGGAYG